jgi:hypothetical protein
MQSMGTTTDAPHPYVDGQNTIAFGDPAMLGCTPYDAGCTWSASTSDSVYYVASDVVLAQFSTWSDSGAAGALDVWSVTAHEAGHQVGLGHANSSDAMTMYYQATLGAIRMRTLAYGDAMGLRCRYGVTAGGC